MWVGALLLSGVLAGGINKNNKEMGCCGSQPLESNLEVVTMDKWQPPTHVTCLLGASGNVGRACLSHLAAVVGRNARILAGSRDPEKLQASFQGQHLPGVEFVQADMASPVETLVQTLRGVHTCFVITPGPVENRGEIALNAAKACKEAGVGFTVMLSVASANKADTIFGRQFGPLETGFWELGIDGCVLRLPMFMENALGHLKSLTEAGKMYSPNSLDAR